MAMTDKTDKIINAIKIIAILSGVVFWTIFISDSPDFNLLGLSECQAIHERAFPFADLSLAIVLVLSMSPWAYRKNIHRQLSIFAGGQMTFLGVIDLIFNLQNGVGLSNVADILFYLICLGCIIFGAVLLVFNTRKP
ncbi:MAG: hypothetical protein V1905_01175 [bacterium]